MVLYVSEMQRSLSDKIARNFFNDPSQVCAARRADDNARLVEVYPHMHPAALNPAPRRADPAKFISRL